MCARASIRLACFAGTCQILVYLCSDARAYRDQTLWPILTRDGSKCAESRKDVPFGDKIFNFNIWPYLLKNVKFCPQNSNFKPKWWNMKVQVYQNQKLLNQWTWKFDTMFTWNSVLNFWDAIWWRHNKCNMADGRHIENRLLAISARFIVWLMRSFVWRSRISQVTWPKYQILKIQDGRRPPFWNWFFRYLSRGSSDFNEIWCAAGDFGFKDGHVTKYQNIANSKWPTAAILKIDFWLYLRDLAYCSISINAKFCVKK